MWCVPDLTAEFVERMEDVLRLYARKFDEKERVVCLDERPVVLREGARRGADETRAAGEWGWENGSFFTCGCLPARG